MKLLQSSAIDKKKKIIRKCFVKFLHEIFYNSQFKIYKAKVDIPSYIKFPCFSVLIFKYLVLIWIFQSCTKHLEKKQEISQSYTKPKTLIPVFACFLSASGKNSDTRLCIHVVLRFSKYFLIS